jgi:GMP synthase (glutamine-hydrolysing)
MTYAIQFHPEVYTFDRWSSTIYIIFLLRLQGVKQDWTPQSFVEETVEDLKDEIR